MTDRAWIKIRSWHAMSGAKVGDKALTVCGRTAYPSVMNTNPTLPAERSCEVCLRIIAREEDV